MREGLRPNSLLVTDAFVAALRTIYSAVQPERGGDAQSTKEERQSFTTSRRAVVSTKAKFSPK